MKRLVTILAGLILAWSAAAADTGQDFAFDQRPGAAVPLEGAFTDATGKSVRLGDFLGRRPAILALGYFHCPSLCSVVRDDLFSALSNTGLRAGADYDLVVLSIDPEETPADAAQAKADDIRRHPAAGAPEGWHYLTGTAGPVTAVEAAVGFRSRYDVHLKQFLHPAGIVALTPDGRVSGYVLGVGYHAGDLAAAVATASAGGIARAALPILLLCFHYDEATGRYSLAIMKVLRLAGVITVAVLGGSLLLAFRRGRKA